MEPPGSSPLVELPGATPIPDESSDIRLFTKCRNESLRLPAFLRHYRQLGVGRFFVADNASTDGSTAYLREQPDVHVFHTEQAFREARGGTDWLNLLLGRFGVGRWCVTVDVDELLCYPGSERIGLRALTSYLDDCGAQALGCQLLDLYPRHALGETAYTAGDDLLAAAPYFDAGPYRRIPHSDCPFFLAYGGIRERVFFPESRRGWPRHLHVALYHRLLLSLPIVRRLPWILAHRPEFPPLLTKVPLVKWDETAHYLNVNHFVSPRRLAAESGVLLHFKLLQDFHARAAHEVARGQYYNGASEFRRYLATLRSHPDLSFFHEGSIRFADSHQLTELGLMQDTAAWSAARDDARARRRSE